MAARRDLAALHQGSLLDRLIDETATKRADVAPSLQRLRDGLRRDLENLFNTRRRFLSWPPELEELERSLLAYGLDDFTNQTLGSPDFRRTFTEQVEAVLRWLEPRVRVSEVAVLDNPDPLDRRLRFRITGVATLGHDTQELSFDSFIDPVECGVVVRD